MQPIPMHAQSAELQDHFASHSWSLIKGRALIIYLFLI